MKLRSVDGIQRSIQRNAQGHVLIVFHRRCFANNNQDAGFFHDLGAHSFDWLITKLTVKRVVVPRDVPGGIQTLRIYKITKINVSDENVSSTSVI